MDLKKYIASVKDFPKEGILFRDITPLMLNGKAFKYAVDEITEFAKSLGATVIVGPEARGFIIGCPVAINLGVGFIPVRKPNKLPREQVSISYSLEYGENELSIHADSISESDRVFIIDDLLATGGTIKATIELVKKLKGTVVGLGFLIELDDLNGRELIKDYPIKSLIHY